MLLSKGHLCKEYKQKFEVTLWNFKSIRDLRCRRTLQKPFAGHIPYF